MAITYTNRKNVTYTLIRTTTKTGKPRYLFARDSSKGAPCESIPDGYEISESVNGIVSLGKTRRKLIHAGEEKLVQQLLDRHPQSTRYRLFVRHNRIDIYELIGQSADELLSHFREAGFPVLRPGALDRFREHVDMGGQFSAVLRFWLHDEERRTFRAERMCYLGSIDDWIGVGTIDSLQALASDMIPRLGTDAYFELY